MPADPMRFEVRDEGIEESMQDIGRRIRSVLPPGWGFNLMIFTYDAGSMFYCSSAKREDMIRAMQEFIAKFREN